MTADEILSIPVDQPERLFARNRIEQQRLELVKIWHPDRNKNPKASAVFAHLGDLYAMALQRAEAGLWSTPGLFELQGLAGKKYLIRFKAEHSLDIGTMYVASSAISFVIDKANADLVEHARKTIRSLSYPSPAVQAEISRFMPEIVAAIEAPAHTGFVVRKTEDVLLLKDVHAHFAGRVDPRHVAWIGSRLWNLACYLQVAKLVHPGIALDSVFISPPYHSALLLGGWWYAVPADAALKAMPAKNLSALPQSLLTDKRAKTRMNGELVKALCRELLGDRTGTSLRLRKDVPDPMAEWLATPASSDAVADYRTWRTVLEACFGKPKFVALELTAADLYTGK